MKEWIKINNELVSLKGVRVIGDIYSKTTDKFPNNSPYDDNDGVGFDITYTDGTEYQVTFPEAVTNEYSKEVITSKLETVREKLFEYIGASEVKEIINVSS